MSDEKQESAAYLLGAALLTVFAVWALDAWIIMVCLDALHNSYASVPAMGYNNSLVAVLLLSVVGGLIRGPRSSK